MKLSDRMRIESDANLIRIRQEGYDEILKYIGEQAFLGKFECRFSYILDDYYVSRLGGEGFKGSFLSGSNICSQTIISW